MSGYRRPDAFTRAAKARGFPARSVFKLEDIDRRARLLRPGQRVLDLGAAPGSWSLYAATRVGRAGRLFAVDLQPLAQALPPNAEFVQADASDLSHEALARYAPYDVVLSDMAPSTTGDRSTDQARSFRLVSLALDVVEALGAPGGSFVAKIFMGPDFDEARRRVRALFAQERVMRPEGVRSSSFEAFLVGTGRKATPPPAPAAGGPGRAGA
jgi:23S rRNA (uridine2552-2'-O)-methyltransferase